jgi:DNA (cytosine-5)-methyltransferase 1
MASDASKSWRLNSFFSGIGGFELAFERHGFSTGFYCENDPFCRSVLERHWPKVPNGSDIGDLNADVIPTATIWTAGFPCQDVSLAKVPHGREGFRGTKSSLFFTFHELLTAHHPKVVLLENVDGLLSSHNGADFQALLEALTDLGYAVAWRLLNARYYGVPQSRPRVFICAWLDDPVRAVSSLFEEECAPKLKGERAGFITRTECPVTGAIVPEISYCISATSARHTGLDWARTYITSDRGVRRLTPLECERLQGFPDHWSVPGTRWVTPIDGNDTARYQALGNAVAIPVVEWIARRIRANLEAGPREATQTEALPLDPASEAAIRKLAHEFGKPGAVVHPLRGRSEPKWQRGGCAFRDTVLHAPASTAPLRPKRSRLVDMIERNSVHDKYFISPNAARGIIRRVDKAGRHLFGPLDARLRQLASGDDGREQAEEPLKQVASR